jgi:hypothetical protein
VSVTLQQPPSNAQVPERIARRLRAKPPRPKIAEQIAAWQEPWVRKCLAISEGRTIDLVIEWLRLQTAGDRSDLLAFFELHDSEQLDRLGKELMRPVDSFPRRETKIAVLMNSAQAGRLLPLPKSIKPLGPKRAK